MALPRDTYNGPVLAGQRWQNRGQSGHDQYLVTVLRLASRSVQVVIEGGGAGHTKAGKKYNVPLAVFRQTHVLVQQVKGYRGARAGVLEDALTAHRLETNPEPEPTPVDIATSTHPVALFHPTNMRLDPVPIGALPKMIENFTAVRDALREAATMPEPEPAAPDPAPAPEAPEAPPQKAPESPQAPAAAPEAPDPALTLLDATSRYLDALGRDLDRMRAEREEFWLEVQSLDKRITVAEAQYETTAAPARALERALRSALLPPVPTLPPSEPEPDRSVDPEPEPATPFEGEAPEEGEPAQPLNQREWVQAWLLRLRALGTVQFKLTDVSDPYGAAFGYDRNRARMNASSILVENMARRNPAPGWPKLRRIERGLYEFV